MAYARNTTIMKLIEKLTWRGRSISDCTYHQVKDCFRCMLYASENDCVLFTNMLPNLTMYEKIQLLGELRKEVNGTR